MRNFVNFLRTPFLQNTSLNISLNPLYFYKIVSPLPALPRFVSLNHRGINMEGVKQLNNVGKSIRTLAFISALSRSSFSYLLFYELSIKSYLGVA